MANLNKVMLIGRLTRDPEMRSFANGGRVASFGFAVNNFKKNPQTGERTEEPVFLDCEAFNRGDFVKLADLVERYLKKGSQAYLEGHLRLDQWDDKATGQKRQKLKVVIDAIQLLDRREGGMEGGSAPAARSSQPAAVSSPGYETYDSGSSAGNGNGGPDESIPF